MKKIACFLLILLICIPSLFSQELPILTVLDFEATNVSASEMRSIINYLSSAIFRTGKYTVIDVSQRDTILKEMEFSMSGCTDETCLLEVGKMLSAEIIVTGSIGKVGSRFLFSAKLLETETGKTIHTADGVYGDLDAVIDDLEGIALRLTSTATADAPVIEEVEEIAEEEAEPPVIIKPPKEKKPVDWKTVGAYSCAAGGLAVVLAGGIQLRNAAEYYQDTVLYLWDIYMSLDNSNSTEEFESAYADYTEPYSSYRTMLYTSFALLGGGLVLGGISTWLFISRSQDTRDTEVAFGLLPAPGGVALAVSLSY